MQLVRAVHIVDGYDFVPTSVRGIFTCRTVSGPAVLDYHSNALYYLTGSDHGRIRNKITFGHGRAYYYLQWCHDQIQLSLYEGGYIPRMRVKSPYSFNGSGVLCCMCVDNDDDMTRIVCMRGMVIFEVNIDWIKVN